MAIQNFLSGGYYGKLGATVGQRWKNKRTIRSYVIPRNPRTPRQQANRGQFGDAVSYSQLGMQMNYLTTSFDNPNYSQWNGRMKTARNLKKNAVTGLNLIPLHPIDFLPPYTITSIDNYQVTPMNILVLDVSGTLPSVSRRVSCLIDFKTPQGLDVGIKLFVGDFQPDSTNKVIIPLETGDVITDQCTLRIVSIDDTDSATDMLVCSELPLSTTPIVLENLIDGFSQGNIIYGTYIQTAPDYVDAELSVYLGMRNVFEWQSIPSDWEEFIFENVMVSVVVGNQSRQADLEDGVDVVKIMPDGTVQLEVAFFSGWDIDVPVPTDALVTFRAKDLTQPMYLYNESLDKRYEITGTISNHLDIVW